MRSNENIIDKSPHEFDAHLKNRSKLFWLKSIALGIFIAVLIGHLGYQIISAFNLILHGKSWTNAMYGLFYCTILGGGVLYFRKPVSLILRKCRLPKIILFLGVALILYGIEELTCYFTNSGIWAEPKPFLPYYFLGVVVLEAWVVGVYIVTRFLKLSLLEVLIITGLAGWFQEVITRIGGADSLFVAIAVGALWIPWATWSYAIPVLIPVTMLLEPNSKPATSGRWWRYPAAFLIPAICFFGIAAPLFIFVERLWK